MPNTPIWYQAATAANLDFKIFAPSDLATPITDGTITAVSPSIATVFKPVFPGSATGLHWIAAYISPGGAAFGGGAWVNLYDTTDLHYVSSNGADASAWTLSGGVWSRGYATLANQVEILSRLTGTVTIQATSITAGQTLTIIRNQAYDDVGANKISITVTHAQDLTAGGTTAQLKIQDGVTWIDALAIASDSITDIGSDQYTLAFPITAAQTSTLIEQGNYNYAVLIVVNGTSNLYPVEGKVAVRRYD